MTQYNDKNILEDYYCEDLFALYNTGLNHPFVHEKIPVTSQIYNSCLLFG